MVSISPAHGGDGLVRVRMHLSVTAGLNALLQVESLLEEVQAGRHKQLLLINGAAATLLLVDEFQDLPRKQV